MMTDSPLSLAIVGLNFGRHIVEQLAAGAGAPHVRLAGLCDLDRAKAEALSAQHGDVPVFDSIDAILATPQIDAIGLYCGPNGRAQLLGQVIRGGKDVMTTKPFESDVAAAVAVLDEARELGRVIHLNSPNPGLSPELTVIQQWRDHYDLGAPVAVRAETWTHYREEAAGDWYDDPQLCPAPPVLRLGIYLINDLVQIFGRARQVSVMQSRLFTGRPTADNAQLGIEFENGALANIYASFCVRDGDHYRNGLTLNFERGTIYRNVGPERAGDNSELALVINDGVWAPRQLAAQQVVPGKSGNYDWPGFAAAVRGAADAPTYQTDHIVEPLRILNAMAKAAQSGKTESVDHA